MTTRSNSHSHGQQPNRVDHRHAPPPPPPQHRHYYYAAPPSSRSSSSSASFKGFCCCLYLLLSFLALITLTALLVILLAFKPKKPQFELQQVTVQYITITPNNNDVTATFSLSMLLLFSAVNPNRVGIRYGDSRFTLMYRGIPLGRASVPGFYQVPHGVTQVGATVTVDRVNLLQADAADLVRDSEVNDRVELRVFGDLAARIRIRIRNLDSPPVQVSVDCVIVISPRKQSLTYKQCGFDGLNV